MLDELFGCGGVVVALCLICGTFIFWKGCAYGEAKAEAYFANDSVYAEFQSAKQASAEKIAASKVEAKARIERERANVEKEEGRVSAMKQEVEFAESLAIPDENTKEANDIGNAEKEAVKREFEEWASSERSGEYSKAIAENQESEAMHQRAKERLAELDTKKKSVLGMIGLAKEVDDNLYDDLLEKGKKAKKNYEEAIGRLQDDYFTMETKKALDEIKRQMDGPHGDDGIRAVIERAAGNAARLREEAESLIKAN